MSRNFARFLFIPDFFSIIVIDTEIRLHLTVLKFHDHHCLILIRYIEKTIDQNDDENVSQNDE